MTVSSISNLVVPFSTGSGRQANPPRSGTSHASCIANITWTTGSRAGSRSGLTSSTTLANGSSWCSSARAVAVWTACTSSLSVASRLIRIRIGTVFMNRPTTNSVSGRVRAAIGTAISRSSLPVSRASTTAYAASKTANSVVPCRAASSLSASARLPSSVAPTDPAANVWCAGYGSSFGRGSADGASASSARQNRPAGAYPPSSACSVCQMAKSAYWIGGSWATGPPPPTIAS